MSLYIFRKLGKQPNSAVEYENGKIIVIAAWGDRGIIEQRLILDRRTARLLAKRILQCLEETKHGK